MEAGCYPTSSYAWKSIIQTQPLISQGTRWIVGDGEHVRFWKDKWLPQSNLLIPKTPGTFAYPHLLVKDLFIPGTKVWDEQKLRNLIEERDVTIVLSIRPSTTGGKDKLHWTYTTSGTYSVKSGYYIQRQLDINTSQDAQVSSLPSSTLQNQLSARLWKISIPPEIKIFWWKVLHNGIPVADNLGKRRIKIARDCQICGEEVETLSHMLFCCKVAKEIWSLSEISTAIDVNQADIIPQTVLGLFSSQDRNPQNTLPWFLGLRIWKMRNNDCQLLIKILHQVQAWEVIKKLKWTTSIIQDIWNYSKNNSFSFSFVPRTCTQYADLLAKMARINDQNYVISWSS
ncbi:hypothetical protein Bca52824_073158 [Brassica carinata]|uniref:Reverse transcriptase zinc-binding domain-containing protein n=1 Tax=Brassica carinata TaxID=52824 RepID=A0A8X7QEV0_BRACI|nr:hypothetical protein Bca52824_073158 [Brassica carinata]